MAKEFDAERAAVFVGAAEESASDGLGKCDTETGIVLRFKALQLERIGELQETLLGLQIDSKARPESRTDDFNKKIDETLHRYADALRNYETLSQNSVPMFPPGARLLLPSYSDNAEALKKLDKWLLSLSVLLFGSSKEFVRWRNFLKKRKIIPDSWWHKECPSDPVEEKKKGNNPSCSVLWLENHGQQLGLRTLDKKSVPSSRFPMALFGGVSVIVPILIMSFHPSKTNSLVTTSVATLFFATIMALAARDCTGKDVLAATAAYAAVLVVFIGTTMTETGT